MDDIGFILGSYVVTLGAVALYAATMIRRARRAARQIPPSERPWT